MPPDLLEAWEVYELTAQGFVGFTLAEWDALPATVAEQTMMVKRTVDEYAQAQAELTRGM